MAASTCTTQAATDPTTAPRSTQRATTTEAPAATPTARTTTPSPCTIRAATTSSTPSADTTRLPSQHATSTPSLASTPHTNATPQPAIQDIFNAADTSKQLELGLTKDGQDFDPPGDVRRVRMLGLEQAQRTTFLLVRPSNHSPDKPDTAGTSSQQQVCRAQPLPTPIA